MNEVDQNCYSFATIPLLMRLPHRVIGMNDPLDSGFFIWGIHRRF